MPDTICAATRDGSVPMRKAHPILARYSVKRIIAVCFFGKVTDF